MFLCKLFTSYLIMIMFMFIMYSDYNWSYLRQGSEINAPIKESNSLLSNLSNFLGFKAFVCKLAFFVKKTIIWKICQVRWWWNCFVYFLFLSAEKLGTEHGILGFCLLRSRLELYCKINIYYFTLADHNSNLFTIFADSDHLR